MAKKKQKTAQGGYNTLRNRLGHFIVGGILIIAGPILSFYYWNIGKDGRASETWPTAKGKITEAKLVETTNILGTQFETKVRYTFVVDGKTYTGDRVKVGGKPASNVADAEADLKRYDVGRPAEVFYDPSDPSRSTLETGGSQSNFLVIVAGGPALTVLGLLLAGIGVVMTLLAWNKRADVEDDVVEDDDAEEERPKSKKAKRQAAADDEDDVPPPKTKKRPAAGENEDEDPPRKRKPR